MKRKLQEEEINYIFSNFDIMFPKFQNKEIKEKTILDLKTILMDELKDEEMYEEDIDTLKQEMERRLMKSIIPSGESVGIVAAQSIGEKNTQLTLNSFHSAGMSQSLVISGVPRFMELLNATSSPKTSICTFRMKDRYKGSIKQMQETIGNSLKEIRLSSLIEYDRLIFDKKEEVWFDSFLYFFDIHELPSTLSITMKLKVDILLRYNITLLDIKTKLESLYDDILVIFSPLHLGQLDIFFFWKEREKESYNEVTLLSFYEDFLHNKLSETILCGIPNITNFFFSKEKDDDIKITTEGSNLKCLFRLKYIDPKTLKSNDLFDIVEVGGIEAGRTFLKEEMTNVISDASYINPCHIDLLCDSMCFSGVVNSISRYGIRKNKASLFTRCSFEESLSHFSTAAIFNENEDLKSVSSCIMVGQHTKVGTGLIQLKPDWNILLENK